MSHYAPDGEPDIAHVPVTMRVWWCVRCMCPCMPDAPCDHCQDRS